MDKIERVKLKRTELMKSFETLPEEQLKVAADLIGQAAFMAVELEDLAEIISKEGMVETYQNGANQTGRKLSSNSKAYSSLVGKYNTIVSRLLKLVPPKPDNKKRDAEIERKMKELKKATEYEYANLGQEAFLDAVRAGTTDYGHYSDFMDEWQAKNTFDDFIKEKGKIWREEEEER